MILGRLEANRMIRFKFNARRLVSLLVCALFSVVGLSSAATKGSSDARFSELLGQIFSGPVHAAGEGTAFVEMETNGSKTSFFIKFAFSGAYSRSQRHGVAEDGTIGQREITWVAGAENLVLGDGPLIVETRPSYQFYREPGYDFHPMTFLSENRRPLRDSLERAMQNSVISKVEDCNDVILVRMKGQSETVSVIKELSLDRNTGLLPCRYSSMYENSQAPERNHALEVTYRWKKWGQKYYLLSLELTGNGFRQRSAVTVEPTLRRTRVQIIDFVPQAQLHESGFRRGALGLPDGYRIWDRNTMKASRYNAKQ
jgi:hypothetical protein